MTDHKRGELYEKNPWLHDRRYSWGAGWLDNCIVDGARIRLTVTSCGRAARLSSPKCATRRMNAGSNCGRDSSPCGSRGWRGRYSRRLVSGNFSESRIAMVDWQIHRLCAGFPGTARYYTCPGRQCQGSPRSEAEWEGRCANTALAPVQVSCTASL
jgi:hypothetical protein